MWQPKKHLGHWLQSLSLKLNNKLSKWRMPQNLVLAAYCYTKDLGRAWRMSEQLEYGMVGINKGLIFK